LQVAFVLFCLLCRRCFECRCDRQYLDMIYILCFYLFFFYQIRQHIFSILILIIAVLFTLWSLKQSLVGHFFIGIPTDDKVFYRALNNFQIQGVFNPDLWKWRVQLVFCYFFVLLSIKSVSNIFFFFTLFIISFNGNWCNTKIF